MDQNNDVNMKSVLLMILHNQYGGFEGFHHYTDFTNLASIMQGGKLYSRNRAQQKGFSDAADQAVIARTDYNIKNYVRFFYKEKTPTLYYNEGIKLNNEKPHMPIPVLLLFDESILFHQNVAFLSGGGGSSCSDFTQNPTMALSFDWKTIFCRLPVKNWSNKHLIINSRNAEFLYPNEIDIKYLKRVIFRSFADIKMAEIIIGNNSLFAVDEYKDKFNYTHNYLCDYLIIPTTKNDFMIILWYAKQPQYYTHKLRIIYKDRTKLDIENIVLDRAKEYDSDFFAYSYMFKPTQIENVDRIQYYMNNNLCAFWRAGL